jgi:hypothetical protein
MRVGVEGARAVGVGNSTGVDRDVARETKWHGPPREASVGMRVGAIACLREGAARVFGRYSPCPDVRALA